MNSNSEYNNKKDFMSCYKEQHYSCSNTCDENRLFFKCGNFQSNSIGLPLLPGTSTNPIIVSAVTVDTSSICDPGVKIDFNVSVSKGGGVTIPNLKFQVFKLCNNEFSKIMVGSTWSYANNRVEESSETLNFFVYDYDVINSKKCTYILEATLTS